MLKQASALTQHLRMARVFSALRHRDFRVYWLGLLLSVGGFQMLWVAQGWLIYELTGQAKSLGLLGLVIAVPTLILSLFGGVLADRLDQRRLLMVTHGISAAFTALLATLVFLDLIQVWHVLVISFLIGAVVAFDSPSRMALFPHLIDPKDLMSAVALNNSVWQGTRIIGPALAGFLIAASGMALPFYVAVACFLSMMLALRVVHVPPIPRAQEGSLLQSLSEGVQFVRRNRLFAFLIGMTFFNSFFGMSYLLLLPVFAKDILEVGAQGLGIMHGVSGTGSLLAIFMAAAMGDSRHKGPILIGGAALFGIFLILFAYSHSYPLSLLLLFLASGSASFYMVMVQTTLQARLPDHLRGRVMGIYSIAWSMVPLGAVQAGFIADLISASFAVALGGLIVAAFALVVATSSPRIRRMGIELVPITP